jgi:hypothetical protein
MQNSLTESVLVLSQDYELFFKDSGTIENCLIEPSERLLKFSRDRGLAITFFVDAGMLRCFDRHASSSTAIRRAAASVRENLSRISGEGHEIGLHIHPHWEDTRWVDGRWRFANTRYQLRDFSDAEIADIFDQYFRVLQDLSLTPVRSYRAGGFCIEPFERLSAAMKAHGITIESSIIPGAKLVDADKGFDFSSLPDRAWWYFAKTPLRPEKAGAFIEIPVTPCTVPRSYYWRQLVRRLFGSAGSSKSGDGTARSIGKIEAVRRLIGASRTSELSIDGPKAPMLLNDRTLRQSRPYWHLMGHPKLLAEHSLPDLQRFMTAARISRTATVASLAAELRATGER